MNDQRRLSANFALSGDPESFYGLHLVHSSGECLATNPHGLETLVDLLRKMEARLSGGPHKLKVRADRLYARNQHLNVSLSASNGEPLLSVAIMERALLTFEAWEIDGLVGGLEAYLAEVREYFCTGELPEPAEFSAASVATIRRHAGDFLPGPEGLWP
jgi:hypothetical protein